ncbi:hypothetical protein KC340_g454 [Hortaea werneckii]|nr:hypothetical protein KC342_g1590 [Hortaea werneckii]KAI7109402.1 hypothetical protein KC339_g826 [Hortaea werneckii]KAI7241774.1 hypothetical protein KC365_g3428 [Hortaea werneckii]KAI7339809.1 hypothetical protein KC340_g454 [Hortaea werneckii]KAI7405901.1 hypothetical protein KC328_g1257 [Hortaea werneckii]
MAHTQGECSVCFEPTNHTTLVAGDPLCSDCFNRHVRVKFIDALRFEHSYPVTWGDHRLKPQDFFEFLPGDFMTAWLEREKEYKIQPANRVYCQHQRPNNQTTEICNHFFGSKIETMGKTFDCPDCHHLTCGTCSEAIHGDQQKHICQANGSATNSQDTFQGQKRGHDYQLCPECSVGYWQADGCNVMRCETPSCSMHRIKFCFLCGEKASHYGGHFAPGQPCVMFGRPGPRGIYAPEHPREEVDRVVNRLGPHVEQADAGAAARLGEEVEAIREQLLLQRMRRADERVPRFDAFAQLNAQQREIVADAHFQARHARREAARLDMMAERFGQQPQPEDAALRLFHAALANGHAGDVGVRRGPLPRFDGLPPPGFHHPNLLFMPRPDPDRARRLPALPQAPRANQGGQRGNEARAQPAQRPQGRGNWFGDRLVNLRARLARLFGEAIPDVPVGPGAAAEDEARERNEQGPQRPNREMPPGVVEALGRENRPLPPLPLDGLMNPRQLRPRADANAALHLAQFPAAAVPDIIEEDFAMRQALLQDAQRDFAEAMRHLDDLPVQARRGLIEVLDDLHNLAGNLRRPVREARRED